MNWISPYSGNEIDPANPNPDQIEIQDIALGLSHTNRYGGQTVPALPVSQHSINVAELMEESGYDGETQLYGLLHDAAEAYLGDVPRPAKKQLDGFEEIEENILDATWEAFDLDEPTDSQWDRVMTADDQVLTYEVAHVFRDQETRERLINQFGERWYQHNDNYQVIREVDDLDLDLTEDPETSRMEFVRNFNDLMRDVQ